MIVSLNSFLRTGTLGTLQRGMSKDEVESLLGPPDDVDAGSHKYRKDSLYLYGTIELWFRKRSPWELTTIWWEPGSKGAFFLTPDCEVTDWAFTPEWTFEAVEDYLRNHDIGFDYCDPPPSESETPWLRLSNGGTISFSEKRLYGITV